MIPGLNEPSERAVSAVHAIQQRLPDLVTKLERIHKQLWWPRLYRPIRLMVDDEYRVLVHFRNRFDGSNHEFLVE